MKTASTTALACLLVTAAILCSGCSGGGETAGAADRSKVTCPSTWRTGWQRLANRIHAPVYCPAWMPDPFDGVIGGRWNTIDSVSKDGSYLIGFIWLEAGALGLRVEVAQPVLVVHGRDADDVSVSSGGKRVGGSETALAAQHGERSRLAQGTRCDVGDDGVGSVFLGAGRLFGVTDGHDQRDPVSLGDGLAYSSGRGHRDVEIGRKGSTRMRSAVGRSYSPVRNGPISS